MYDKIHYKLKKKEKKKRSTALEDSRVETRKSKYVCVCVCVCELSRARLFTTLWTVAHQAPLSMGFPRQEYWSGLLFPSPGIFLTQGLNPGLLHWQEDSLPLVIPSTTPMVDALKVILPSSARSPDDFRITLSTALQVA